MTQEEKDQLKANLINEIVFLSDVEEELWRYHPENPSKTDVVWEYNMVKEQIKGLEHQLNQLG